MAYIVMAFALMVYIVMAYIVMAYIVMAYTVPLLCCTYTYDLIWTQRPWAYTVSLVGCTYTYGLYGDGLYGYGRYTATCMLHVCALRMHTHMYSGLHAVASDCVG